MHSEKDYQMEVPLEKGQYLTSERVANDTMSTCPECKKSGFIIARHIGVSRPEVFKEKGILHYHDKTECSVHYRCEGGHKWKVDVTGRCYCGWPQSMAAIPRTGKAKKPKTGNIKTKKVANRTKSKARGALHVQPTPA